MRTSTITRKTAETDISVEINLDGTGIYDNQTGVGFFDHMLDQLARHSLIDMKIRATGDLHLTISTPLRTWASHLAKRWSRRWATSVALTATATAIWPWTMHRSAVRLTCPRVPT